ncbi:MAG: N-acetyltransferase [Pseudomonadota bacterium]
MDPSFTRDARHTDHAAIDRLLVASFGGPQEAQLVRNLRAEGAVWQETVMPWGEEAAGYLAISRFVAPDGWLCLAPVAVHPDWQGEGRGQFMVEQAVEEFSKKLKRFMVVVGDGKFYRRCGFLATRAARLTSPYGTENTLLIGPDMSVPTETLIYPKAFAKLT